MIKGGYPLKKIKIAAAVIIMAAVVLAGCSKYGIEIEEKSSSTVEINSGITDIGGSGTSSVPESSVPEEPAHHSPTPQYDVNSIQINKMLDIVKPFNVYPEEFEDASTLSDYCIFFTVTEACNMRFGTDELTGVEKLPISEFTREVDKYFGGKASMSKDWKANDYTPYVIDRESDCITRNSTGSVGSYYYTYKVIDQGNGTYELWLLDLMDPLFYDDIENRDKLDKGQEILWEDVDAIADQMTTNVYTLTIGDEGYFLSGFRYINYKEIEHFGF